jgi:hypothetical protein
VRFTGPRRFSFITQNWRAKPLVSQRTIAADALGMRQAGVARVRLELVQ